MKPLLRVLVLLPVQLAATTIGMIPDRGISAAEQTSLQFLQDKVSEVPEPQTWSTIGIGLSMVGAGLLRKVRRRKL